MIIFEIRKATQQQVNAGTPERGGLACWLYLTPRNVSMSETRRAYSIVQPLLQSYRERKYGLANSAWPNRSNSLPPGMGMLFLHPDGFDDRRLPSLSDV